MSKLNSPDRPQHVTARGFAKINLALAVTGRRSDGYHELDTVMRTVSLWDSVDVERTSEPGILLRCTDPKVPLDRRNTAYKAAAEYVERTALPGGLRITIQKSIPMEAGMGGSSADAAAVLTALQTLWCPLPVETLAALAVSLGADVPFQLSGGLARCKGVGERIQPLEGLRGEWYVVCKPPFGIRTPEAFAACDGMKAPCNPDVDALCTALLANDLSGVAACVGNALERAVNRPDLTQLEQALLKAGARGACMTGSGSAVFGLFGCAASAERACVRLQDELPGVQVFSVRGCSVGEFLTMRPEP